MRSERELFEKEYCKVQMIENKGDTFNKYHNGDYIRHSLHLAWLMWQASAQRQGYKLVPVDPTKEMLNSGYKVKHEKIIDLGNVYKAMIGA